MKKQLFFFFFLVLSFLGFAQKKTIKVACIGNSITYGYLLGNRERDAYPSVLQKKLGKPYVVGNFGKSGATLLSKGHRPYIEQEEYKQALAFAGDIVVIHLGINDTDPRNWPNYRDDFIPDYLTLIHSFKKVNPKAHFLIALMTPIGHTHPRFESGTRDWHTEIQQAIESIAKEANAQLIDFHSPLYAYPQLLPDAVHPNAEGAAMIAQVVYSAITGDYGGLQLPAIYGDNMVLQHGKPFVIEGIANAGARVDLSIGTQHYSTTATVNGQWQVHLSPLKAKETYTLNIRSGKESKVFKNIIAGDVWLCSGQSNMEFTLDQTSTGANDIQQATYSNIRFCDMKARWRTDAVQWSNTALDSINHLQYFTSAQWQTCSPETAGRFSAVGYYFGKKLQEETDIPIGLICNAVGGSPIEAWVDRHTLERNFPRILNDWRNNDFIMDWVRKRAGENIAKATDKNQRHPYEPCYLYEASIAPLKSLAIKGVVWYQGESNAHNKDAYSKLFTLLVESWRNTWNQADMPFYYVQLSSINRPSWGWFRETQRRLLYSSPHLGMAVSYDCGHPTDVHPKNKRPIGERLAYWALYDSYNHKDIVPSGPLCKSVLFSETVAILDFDYSEGLQSNDGKALRSFEVAGSNGIFYPATAHIVGNKIEVSSIQVTHPVQVRYGFSPFTDGNLVNGAGLPASTFLIGK